jgi:hypothetical protein
MSKGPTDEEIDAKAQDIADKLDRGDAKGATQALHDEINSLKPEEMRKLIAATHRHEKENVGLDLSFASATLDDIRNNPKLQDKVFMHLTDKDHTFFKNQIVVGQTERGFKSFKTVDAVQQEGMYIARDMDRGDLESAAWRMRHAVSTMGDDDFKKLVKTVDESEAKGVKDGKAVDMLIVGKPGQKSPKEMEIELFRQREPNAYEKEKYGADVIYMQKKEVVAKGSLQLPHFDIVEK